ncbi:MAG TPA: polysaccharide biosynthesis tyrosine autokinase [Rickettsiales bacterium]|nr:polysaccharide biosynthesis tyrosine autokinase [Rickettsiales bacterium]
MYSNSSSTHTMDSIPSLQDILWMLWRRRFLMLKIMLTTLILGVSVVFLLPSSYKATAIVILSDHSLNLADFQDVTEGTKFDETTVQTEVDILNSLAVAKQTVQATALDKAPDYASLKSMDDVLDKFVSHLTVKNAGTSRAVEVSFKSHDPELSAKVANAHAAAYFNEQVTLKKERLAKVSQWFEARIKDAQADVQQKSKAVEDYRAAQNLVVGKNEEQLIYQEISNVAEQLLVAEGDQYAANSKITAIDSAKKEAHPNALPGIINSNLIQNLKAQASTTSQELGALRSKYGPNHPKVIEAESELKQINHAIASEENLIKRSAYTDNTEATAQVKMLRERLQVLNQQENDLRGKQIALSGLQAQEEASEKLLNNLLKNYASIQSQETLARPDAYLASPAVPPDSPTPPKSLLLAIVAVFSVSLALFTVFFMEIMRGGIRNFEDIRRLAQKPIGIIPQIAEPLAAMLSRENTIYKEAIKRIYMSGIMNSAARAILVTSALPKEGRSTFTVSMAYYLMSLGHKVLVIDADFMFPTISKMTGDANGLGFTDALIDNELVSKAIVTDRNGFCVMRAGGQALHAPDALRSTNLRTLLDKLKQNYNYILIDSCPLLANSEANSIAEQADGIMVVTEWIKTPRQSINNMLAILQGITTPVLGVAINKVDIGKYKTITVGSDFLLPKLISAA